VFLGNTAFGEGEHTPSQNELLLFFSTNQPDDRAPSPIVQLKQYFDESKVGYCRFSHIYPRFA
jgi:hypothetical protein